MKRKPTAPAPPPERPDDIEEGPATDDDSAERVVARPDGFHWVSPDGRQEFGPFETYEDAMVDMLAAAEDESAEAPAEALQDVEDELGIASWVDPDTGELAEGQSPPHLDEG